MKAIKHNKGKLEWTLLLKDLATVTPSVVRVLMLGRDKYGRGNWQSGIEDNNFYLDPIYRHLNSYVSGEKIDDESGESHLAHVICCALFLMWYDNE